MVIISGDLRAMVECKKRMPFIPAYWVIATGKDEKTGQYLPYDDVVISQAVTNGLTGLNLRHNGLTRDFVEKAHNAGLEMFVWTVNDVDIAETMIEYGVDGITTDIPGVMKSEVN